MIVIKVQNVVYATPDTYSVRVVFPSTPTTGNLMIAWGKCIKKEEEK